MWYNYTYKIILIVRYYIMNELLEKLDKIATECEINTYRISISTADGFETLNRLPANPCQDCYSIAKLFCVTAIGMLFDEGKLTPATTVSEILAEELKEYGIPAEKWANITLDHIMRHEIGFEKGFLDIDTEDITKYPTDDFLFMVLDRELVYAPGETRVYSDAAYYLISRVITKISGERLDDFLMDRLFSKIGCREVAWSKCPRKYPVGATGLYIRSDDVVKLGRIYLDGGVWQGERIISEEWIRIVLERGYELREFGNGFSKGGMRGQRLYVNFDKNVAVAWHSFDPDRKNTALGDAL